MAMPLRVTSSATDHATRYLMRALSLRDRFLRAAPATGYDDRALFERAVKHVARLLNTSFRYVIVPAHTPSWLLPLDDQVIIILSGSRDEDYRAGLSLLGQAIWYTDHDEYAPRAVANAASTLFAGILRVGVVHP